MKAVFQNSMFALLALACVVFAAPHQHLHHPRPEPLLEQADNQSVVNHESTTPTLADGTARFACW